MRRPSSYSIRSCLKYYLWHLQPIHVISGLKQTTNKYQIQAGVILDRFRWWYTIFEPNNLRAQNKVCHKIKKEIHK